MKHIAGTIGISLVLLTGLSFKNDQPTTILHVRIDHITYSGNLLIGLYNQPKGFGKVEYMYKKITYMVNNEGSVSLDVDSLSAGEYAIAILQDLNGNGKMDTKLLVMPQEPYGFSNNIRPKLSIPSFEDCKFSVPANRAVEISLINP